MDPIQLELPGLGELLRSSSPAILAPYYWGTISMGVEDAYVLRMRDRNNTIAIRYALSSTVLHEGLFFRIARAWAEYMWPTMELHLLSTNRLAAKGRALRQVAEQYGETWENR